MAQLLQCRLILIKTTVISHSKLNETLKEVDSILRWFYQTKEKPLPILIDKKEKLSVLSFYVAEQLSDLKAQYNLKYYDRRISFTRSVNRQIKEGAPVSKAEYIGREETNDILQEEMEIENLAYRLENILKSIKQVLDAMRDSFVYLKAEYDRTYFQK